MIIDTTLSDSQIKQLSLSISINDVLDCIRKDCDGYLKFLNEELENQEITECEYRKEIELIMQLKNEQKGELK